MPAAHGICWASSTPARGSRHGWRRALRRPAGFIRSMSELRLSRSFARAGLVASVAVYLTYETGRYHLLGIPIPLLAAAIAVPLLLAWTESARRNLDPRTVGWAAAIVAGLVGVGIAAFATFHELDGYGLLPDWVVDDAAKVLDAANHVRIFDGSLFYVVAVAAVGLLVGASLGVRQHMRPGLTHAETR